MPSLIDSHEHAVISHFPGADLLRDAEDLGNKHIPGAALSRNVEFLTGQVRTRRGFGLFHAISIEANRFFNWLLGSFNRNLYFSRNAGAPKVVFIGLEPTLPQDDVKTGITATTVDAIFRSYGSRAIMAFLDATGRGSHTACIWNGLFTNGIPDVDDVFQDPLVEGSNFTVGFTEPLAGSVTAGEHRFAVSWTTRNEYETRAVEFNSTFTAAGSKNLVVTLTPVGGNWPDWARRVRLAMTTVQNQAQFIWVGDAGLPFQQATPVNIVVDLDDTTLASTVDVADATDWFSLISKSNPFAPEKPMNMVGYGNRFVWISLVPDAAILGDISAVLVSDPGDPQRISADRSLIYLPERRLVIAAFVLHNTLYLVGPAWIYSVVDNNDQPVTWAQAQLVDGRIGTVSAYGVASNPSRGVAWIASRDGLYPFTGGAIPQLPVSYLQTPDWDRINWSVPSKVSVIDDGTHDQVHVFAPLDQATEPSHWMTFDYKEGFDWTTVKYSLNDFIGLAPGAPEVVQNPATQMPELMISSSGTDGSVYRQKSSIASDPLLYNDNGLGIDSPYQTPPLPGTGVAPMRIKGAHIRVHGQGTLGVRVGNVNGARISDLAPIAAQTNPEPEGDYLRLFDKNSESSFLEINNGGVADSYFVLSRVVVYWKKWLSKR